MKIKTKKNKNYYIQFKFNLKQFLESYKFNSNRFLENIEDIIKDKREIDYRYVNSNDELLVFNDMQFLSNGTRKDISNGCINFTLYSNRKINIRKEYVLGVGSSFIISESDLNYFYKKFVELFFSQTVDLFAENIGETIQSFSSILANLSNTRKIKLLSKIKE